MVRSSSEPVYSPSAVGRTVLLRPALGPTPLQARAFGNARADPAFDLLHQERNVRRSNPDISDDLSAQPATLAGALPTTISRAREANDALDTDAPRSLPRSQSWVPQQLRARSLPSNTAEIDPDSPPKSAWGPVARSQSFPASAYIVRY
jgi:hypothetical protein